MEGGVGLAIFCGGCYLQTVDYGVNPKPGYKIEMEKDRKDIYNYSAVDYKNDEEIIRNFLQTEGFNIIKLAADVANSEYSSRGSGAKLKRVWVSSIDINGGDAEGIIASNAYVYCKYYDDGAYRRAIEYYMRWGGRVHSRNDYLRITDKVETGIHRIYFKKVSGTWQLVDSSSN